MPGRFAVDFGTSNTLLALWDDARKEGALVHIPDFGRQYRQGDEQVSLVPSLIHYAGEERRWIGQQVIERGLNSSNGTFRWMKRYILNRSPLQVQVDGHGVSHQQAGRDFLTTLLVFAREQFGLGDEEVAFSAPVESFEHYEEWLASVAASARLPRFRLIDEPAAAALGYGAHIQPGDVYLIFDFGGGTLNVSVVLIEPEEAVASGRRCRVLGKAGAEIGGATIDQWLYREVLKHNRRHDSDDEVRAASAALLVACERLKEELSYGERAELRLPVANGEIEAAFTQAQFEDLLDEHGVFTTLDRTLRRALLASAERGYQEEHVKSVLMVGGTSQIPAVQKAVRRAFGRERVLLHRPLTAVVRGAAAFAAGVDFYDHIQHDYAIRYTDTQRGAYEYRPLVPRGTPYPSAEPLARLTVRATREGQTRLGIAIFEIGQPVQPEGAAQFELVFDPSGAARVANLPPESEGERARFWMNEHNPTFLQADPPAAAGEPRFEVTFSIDANKRLLVTARDLRTGEWTLHDAPVVRLA